jgi:hypothetical protein
MTFLKEGMATVGAGMMTVREALGVRTNQHQEQQPKKIDLATYKSPQWRWFVDIQDTKDKAKAEIMLGNVLIENKEKVAKGKDFDPMKIKGQLIRTSEFDRMTDLIAIFSQKFKEIEASKAFNITWTEAKRLLPNEVIGDKRYYTLVLDIPNYYESIFGCDMGKRDLRDTLTTIHQHPSQLIRFREKEGWQKGKYKQTLLINTQIIQPVMPFF